MGPLPQPASPGVPGACGEGEECPYVHVLPILPAYLKTSLVTLWAGQPTPLGGSGRKSRLVARRLVRRAAFILPAWR